MPAWRQAAHSGTPRSQAGQPNANVEHAITIAQQRHAVNIILGFFCDYFSPRRRAGKHLKSHTKMAARRRTDARSVIFMGGLRRSARGVGVAGASALVPQPAAFAAAAERKADDEQAQNGGKARGHGTSLAHRRRAREWRFSPWPAAACRRNRARARSCRRRRRPSSTSPTDPGYAGRTSRP